MSKSFIKLHHVSKSFKGEVIFDQIDLELDDEKIYGLVGRNGSGKSVLLKLITGLMRVDSGDVLINGQAIGKDVDFPDRLGALIEHPGFLWSETAMENLMFLAGIKNRIGKEEVKKAILQVGLDPQSRKKVGKYSLGMKQRLGIAQAIMENPDILILDEPMNGLDEDGIIEIRELIKLFRQPGKVVILASHNKEDIDALCDKVFYVKSGKIIPLE